MIRAVLAVAVATALVGVAMPAIEDARLEASDRLVRGELAAIERAGESLLAADETTPSAGSRRVVTVDLPASTWRSAGVDRLAIHGIEQGADTGVAAVTYRLDGRQRRVTLGVPLHTDDGPLVLDDGSHRLVLEMAERDGRRVVAIRRVGT